MDGQEAGLGKRQAEEKGLSDPGNWQRMTPGELKALIRTIPDFPRPGIQFRDITPLIAHPQGLAGAVVLLAERAEAAGAQAIAGIEARGFIFGAAVAAHLGIGFIPIRKAGKLPVDTLMADYALEYGVATIELDPTCVEAGAHVVLVDDLIATGGTAVAGTQLLRQAGARVDHALFVIDLPVLGGTAVLAGQGIAAHALFDFPGH
jgi:adenine phosphoribosyltransferase